MTQTIRYTREQNVDTKEFRRVLEESGLSAIRPASDEPRLKDMLAGASLVVTARTEDGALVGIARCVTDFAWCCYLSDLAVSRKVQKAGVGKGLLDEVRRQIGPRVALILASVPEAVGFYERAGMEPVPNVFWYPRTR